MSIAGKCDLYDHVYSIGTSGTNHDMSKKELFEAFKKRTGGVLYQGIPIKVTKFNIDLLIENNKNLERTDHNTYLYFGKEYKTLKSLNKEGVYYTRKITFDTMLDLVPYLPYIIGVMLSGDNNEIIYIGERSYIDSKYLEHLEYGNDASDVLNHDMKRLQQEYIDTIKEM